MNKIKFEGISPFLMNRPIKEEIEGTLRDVPLEERIYTNGGGVFLPMRYIFGAGRAAAKQILQPSNRRQSWENNFISNVSFIETEIIMTPNDIKDWVNNPLERPLKRKDGNTIWQISPQAYPWSIDFNIEVNETLPAGTRQRDKFDMEVVRQIFEYAGKYIGLGQWRKAGFGRFKVIIV